MGTATPPACRMPKRAGTNSGQFLSHKPTRSPGFTPNTRRKWPETSSVFCPRALNEYSRSPQNKAILSGCFFTLAEKALTKFIVKCTMEKDFQSSKERCTVSGCGAWELPHKEMAVTPRTSILMIRPGSTVRMLLWNGPFCASKIYFPCDQHRRKA